MIRLSSEAKTKVKELEGTTNLSGNVHVITRMELRYIGTV